MKYYLIAGEASGDLHASNLMEALKKEDREAEFRFFGGERMQAAGGTLVRHYREMAYMGVVPVLLHARTIGRNMHACREDIRTYRPDVVIPVDYPGFNLRIAKFVKTQLNLPVYYYISPKIWAWKKYRIRSLRRYVDHLFCILPFEVAFFRTLHYPVDYVGNPSVDSVSAFRSGEANRLYTFKKANGLDTSLPLIALLAGSRKAEIRQNLPAMLAAVAQFPGFRAVVAAAPGLTPEDYRQVTGNDHSLKILYGQTYELLAHASAAIVTSGTATLETALFRVPQVVCYAFAGGRLINYIFDHLFHVPYISLVNLIAGKEIVRELFGANFSAQKIREELRRIIEDNAYKNKMLRGYDRVSALLGLPGASTRAAKLIVRYLSAATR